MSNTTLDDNIDNMSSTTLDDNIDNMSSTTLDSYEWLKLERLTIVSVIRT